MGRACQHRGRHQAPRAANGHRYQRPVVPTDLYGISGIPCIILSDPTAPSSRVTSQGEELTKSVRRRAQSPKRSPGRLTRPPATLPMHKGVCRICDIPLCVSRMAACQRRRRSRAATHGDTQAESIAPAVARKSKHVASAASPIHDCNSSIAPPKRVAQAAMAKQR